MALTNRDHARMLALGRKWATRRATTKEIQEYLRLKRKDEHERRVDALLEKGGHDVPVSQM